MDEFESISEKIRAKANEILEKSKCVRCSNDVPGGGPGARCGSCRKKLNSDRQTVGHNERAQNKAQQAIRRENHGNGKATPKSKGKAESNAKLANSFQNAEKKAGEKLSPDRKDNSQGYSKHNTRHVAENLNRGRHEVDPKKLKEFKERLNKTGLTVKELATLIALKTDCDQ
jgi:hypothetical protein